MSKNDSFEKIMKEIVANIPEGDKEIFKYLNEQMRSYKGHKYEQEIARACGRLLYERLSPDARKKFDDAVHKDSDGFESVIKEIQFKIHQKEYDSALKMLEEIIEKYEKLNLYKDDNVSMYFNFEDPFQSVLYIVLNKPDKDVREAQFNYARIYLIYGSLLFELRRFEEAIVALEKAKRWNPVCPDIAFELAEAHKAIGDTDGFFKKTQDIFKYLYNPFAIARYYRNLGFYYVEKEEYETAACCLDYSGNFQRSEMIQSELYYISTKCGRIINPTEEDIEKCFKENDIQKAPTTDVLGIAFSVGKQCFEDKQYGTAKFFLGIVDTYIDDDQVRKMLTVCDENK